MGRKVRLRKKRSAKIEDSTTFTWLGVLSVAFLKGWNVVEGSNVVVVVLLLLSHVWLVVNVSWVWWEVRRVTWEER